MPFVSKDNKTVFLECYFLLKDITFQPIEYHCQKDIIVIYLKLSTKQMSETFVCQRLENTLSVKESKKQDWVDLVSQPC